MTSRTRKIANLVSDKAYVERFIEGSKDAPLGFALWCQKFVAGTCNCNIKGRRRQRCTQRFFGLKDYRETGKIEIHRGK